ncbi:hypothetical protein GA076_24430 [Vibrio parahaemolyticus]|nr:hypothetical protein [Vibrio parahaemolyticus]EIO4610144.1 hypothetical protein [Vibrio parahaemolyticus]
MPELDTKEWIMLISLCVAFFSMITAIRSAINSSHSAKASEKSALLAQKNYKASRNTILFCHLIFLGKVEGSPNRAKIKMKIFNFGMSHIAVKSCSITGSDQSDDSGYVIATENKIGTFDVIILEPAKSGEFEAELQLSVAKVKDMKIKALICALNADNKELNKEVNCEIMDIDKYNNPERYK